MLKKLFCSLSLCWALGYTVVSIAHEQLYVGNAGGDTLINVFDLPLTDTSTPSVSVPSTASYSAWGFAFDAHDNLYVADPLNNSIDVFTLPLTAASLPSFVINASYPQGITIDAEGRLFATDGTGFVHVYNPPFSSESRVAFSLTSTGNPYQMTFDAVGNLIVADCKGYLQVYHPPFADENEPSLTIPAPNSVCVGGVAINATMDKLYVTSADVYIFIYHLPLVGDDVPVEVITGPSTLWSPSLALDQAGNLYAGDFFGNNIGVFPKGHHTPSVIQALSFNPAGIAVR